MNSQGIAIKYIPCDDDGENRGLMNQIQGACWKTAVQFELTGRHTLQKNHLAEVGFATIAGCGRAMMNAAKIPKSHCENFWMESFQTEIYPKHILNPGKGSYQDLLII
jgi:hypothetical protein